MQPRHRVSRAAIELIKRFEGYRRQAAQLPDGRWTIGHGHTLTARQGAEVSPDDAEALLLYDLIAISHALNETIYAPLGQNQFDALASFAFNLGLDNFRGSGVLRRLNEGALVQAACAMELWRKADVGGERIVVDALVRRRSAEKALFLTPEGEAWVPAPSPVLRPLLDTDAGDVIPRQAPAEVTTAMDGETIEVLRHGEPALLAPSPPDEDEQGPVKVAAESVTARLSRIFQDPGHEPGSVPVVEEVRADAEFSVPPTPAPQLTDPLPFFLRAPEPEEMADDPEPAEDPVADEAPDGPDLFDLPHVQAFPDAPESEPEGDVEDEAEGEAEREDALGEPFEDERSIIDDTAPYEFVAPVVQPLPVHPQGGVFTLIALAVLGLAFFGGGIFWATYARPMRDAAWLEPRTVGLIAGVTGVLFFAAAVFLLLERLGKASERRARNRA